MSTVTVTPTVELSNVPPRVRLDVVDAGSPAVAATTVLRRDPDGRQRAVRTQDGGQLPLSGGSALIYDYEPPFGSPVSYTTAESPGVVSAEVTVAEDRVWLIHPGVPGLSMPVQVASLGTRTRRVQRGVYYPMGRRYPIVQTDGQRKGHEGTIELRVDSLPELADLESLTDSGSVLLLNVPAGLGWGVDTCYISVGDIDEARLVDYAPEQRRYYLLPFLVVDRPEGGTQAQRTLADLEVYPTLDDLGAAYATLNDVLAGP